MPPCDGIEVREGRSDIDRFVSYSHVSMTIPIDDPHYGMDGNYATCLTYEDQPEIYRQCSTDDENTVYAEGSYLDENSRYDGKLVRRTTFNPGYAEMIADIKCFVDAEC